MSGCSNMAWSHSGPTESGFYEVRPCPRAWKIGPDTPYEPPQARIAYVDVGTGRFDAGTFGGDIAEPLWEWTGPIRVPVRLPDRL